MACFKALPQQLSVAKQNYLKLQIHESACRVPNSGIPEYEAGYLHRDIRAL
jgi:hypothetical protein